LLPGIVLTAQSFQGRICPLGRVRLAGFQPGINPAQLIKEKEAGQESFHATIPWEPNVPLRSGAFFQMLCVKKRKEGNMNKVVLSFECTCAEKQGNVKKVKADVAGL